MTLRRSRLAVVVGASALAASGFVPMTLAATHAGAATARLNTMCGKRASAPKYKHVIVIAEENHSFGSISGSSNAPYINSVMAACGLATNFHSITHNSLPNYLALAFGGTIRQLGPYVNDCEPAACSSLLSSTNIFNQLSKKGWMSYQESMPSKCSRTSSGNYAPKHNPALYFSDLKASCAAHDVSLGIPFGSPLLRAFSKEKTAPAFSFVTPNLCNDMHDCSVRTGDDWLKTWLPLITSTAVYKANDTAVFVVWDEGEPGSTGENCAANTSDQSCHVVAMVIAPSVIPGTKVATSFSHYSVLKTAEDLLGVAELGGAKSAASMVKGFNL